MLPDRGPDGNTVIFVAPDGLVVVDTGRHPWHSDGILGFARDRKAADRRHPQHPLAPRSLERQRAPQGRASGGPGLHDERGAPGHRPGRIRGPQPRSGTTAPARRQPDPARGDGAVPGDDEVGRVVAARRAARSVGRAGDRRPAAGGACHSQRRDRGRPLALRREDRRRRARRPRHPAGAVLRDRLSGALAGARSTRSGRRRFAWRCPDTASR